MLKRLILLFWVLSGLAVVLVVSVFAQEAQWDSTKMKLLWERVKVEVLTDEEYECLQQMGIECPQRGECEVIINMWQRTRLEKKRLKVTRLQRLRPDEGPNQVEYKLVREVDLEKESIGGVVFASETATRSSFSVMAQRDYQQIQFFSSQFWLLHTYEQTERYTEVYPSKRLQYVGIVTPLKIPTRDEPVGRIRFTLINNKGQKLWETEKETVYEAIKHLFFISDDGLVVEANRKTGSLVFYDKSGGKNNEVEFFKGGIWDPETHSLGGEFSSDGRYFIAVGHDHHGKVFPKGSGIMLFDSKGNELWRYDIERDLVTSFAVSPKGKFAIITGFDWDNGKHTNKVTYLLTQEGEIGNTFKDIYATGIGFSIDEEYAVLIAASQQLYIIGTENAQITFKYSVLGRPRQIKSVDIAEDAKMFGLVSCYSALGRPRPETEAKEKNIQVVLIRFDGRKVWSETFPFEGGRLSLSLSDDGKQMAIQIGSRIMIYELVE